MFTRDSLIHKANICSLAFDGALLTYCLNPSQLHIKQKNNPIMNNQTIEYIAYRQYFNSFLPKRVSNQIRILKGRPRTLLINGLKGDVDL